jgi:hypothetical protein
MPAGFVALLLHQRASPLTRPKVGAKDLGARGAQLLADQRLRGLRLIAAALLVLGRIGHCNAGTAPAASETATVRARARAGGRAGRDQSLAVTASSTLAKRSRAAARRVGTCSVGSSPAGGA